MQGRARDELKYIMRARDKDALMALWGGRLERDPHTNKHALTFILSQYYDSPDLLFYTQKLDGIAFRNKIRMRTYNASFEPGQTVFIEIKQRVFDKVRKVRQRMENFQFENFDPSTWTFENQKYQSAFNALLEKHLLRPSAQVWYQREAWQGSEDPEVRVTFDSCLTGLFPGEKMSAATMEDPLRRMLPDHLVVLEVKANNAVPSWIHQGIRMVELQQQTVPKYVMAVEKLGMHKAVPSGVYV